MREFFYPNSVAVIGVSSKPTNLGRNIVANLVEYEFNGIVYAVGPSGGMVETRRIYHSVGDIPDHVDLAVIFTPAKTVPGVLEECGRKGIRWVVIETAGFREYGEEGKQLEDEIVRIASKYGIRFVGPNCIGVMNHGKWAVRAFSTVEEIRQGWGCLHDHPERRRRDECAQSDGERRLALEQVRFGGQCAGYQRRRFAGVYDR